LGTRLFADHSTILPPDDPRIAQIVALHAAAEHYTGPDQSVAAVLAALAPNTAAAAYAARWIANVEAADLDRLSAKWLARERSDSTAGGQNFHLTAGYDAVPHYLARGLDIRLGCVVERIAWDEGGARVGLADGTTLRARHVVITIPISLLQRGAIHFDPALPDERRAAIDAIAVGHVIKLALWFDQVVWPPMQACSTDGLVVTWWPVGTPDQPVLMGFTGGPAALALADRGEAAAVAQGLAEATALFGPAVGKYFVGGRLSDWSREPWSLGSYTYTPIGAGNARAVLAAPLANTLYFAGEAIVTNGHIATVHGAIESGRTAANAIVACL
jgi:monoamine oxidase